MKGSRLIVLVSLIVAVSTGVLVAIMNKKPSWSQQHNTDYDFLLYLTLGSILITFIKASDNHPQREREITSINWLPKRLSIKLKHGFFITALMFLGIITFGVNHRLEWVVNLHLMFTGLAILTGYLTMLTYPEGNNHKWSNIGAAIGLTGFILGFVFNLYSVSWAEVIISIPLAIFIFVSYIKFRTFDKTKDYENNKNS